MTDVAFGGDGVIDELVAIINAAYLTGEVGIWLEGWRRVTRETVERLIAAGEMAVAWRHDRPVGCVRTRRLDAHTAELGMLSVDPAAHRTGAGRALIAFAERAFDVDEMELELLVPRGAPHPDKVRLDAWYRRLGYRVVGRRDFAEPLLAAPADLVVYRKNLRAAPANEAPLRAPT